MTAETTSSRFLKPRLSWIRLFFPVFFLSGIGTLLPSCGALSGQPRPLHTARITTASAQPTSLDEEISALGYGNWIVIAEASFPVHSRPGVRTVVIDAEIPEVLDHILKRLEYSDSVQPLITTARELPYVPASRAPGIDHHRQQLDTLLEGREARQLDYHSLGLLLQDSSHKFAVLVIKTNTSLPYTSVFLELQSNYWDHENEGELRRAMPHLPKPAAPRPPRPRRPDFDPLKSV